MSNLEIKPGFTERQLENWSDAINSKRVELKKGLYPYLEPVSYTHLVPVIAAIYVPLSLKLGFSPAAIVFMIAVAAALGDAGSPASDTTLGPTAGLNADGQHDHIWDTCVPQFICYDIPLMVVGIICPLFMN